MQELFVTFLLWFLPAARAQESAPGLLPVPGGPTKVGSRVEDVERWLREGDRTFAGFLAGETPQFETPVDDFLLMVSEVTQEQYAVFVEATGVRPPYSWAPAPVEAAREEFLEAEGRREPDAAKRRTWDPDAWWDAHWREHPFAVPAQAGALPVVNVSQEECAAYARWAGLRLMEEAEFARACRGDSDRLYPWGDTWDAAACNSILFELGGPAPVGSFAPHGGFVDLVGNVWEWTMSPYQAFGGYELLRVDVRESGRSFEVEALAPFDSADRVAVGGSFLQNAVGLHSASRRAKRPRGRESYLGFRCAASAVPGLDAARAVLTQDIAGSVASGLEFDPSRTAIHQRWSTRPGTADVAGYQVIESWTRVFICPVTALAAGTRVALQRQSADQGPVVLGFLTTSVELQEPTLAPGTYLVAWRAPGKTGELDPLASLAGLDPERSSFVFLDSAGLPQAAVPAGEASFGRLAGPSAVDPIEGGLRFTLAVPGSRREGLRATLELATAR